MFVNILSARRIQRRRKRMLVSLVTLLQLGTGKGTTWVTDPLGGASGSRQSLLYLFSPLPFPRRPRPRPILVCCSAGCVSFYLVSFSLSNHSLYDTTRWALAILSLAPGCSMFLRSPRDWLLRLLPALVTAVLPRWIESSSFQCPPPLSRCPPSALLFCSFASSSFSALALIRCWRILFQVRSFIVLVFILTFFLYSRFLLSTWVWGFLGCAVFTGEDE